MALDKERNEKGCFVKGRTPWNKGKTGIYSEETKGKMRIAKLGHIAWNEGIPCTEERKEKIREANKEKHYSPETEFKKGEIAWNKNLTKEVDERVRNISKSLKGNHNSRGTEFGKDSEHWNWQGGITPLAGRIRNCFKCRQWKSDVFTRDDFTCQDCGDNISGNLETHHIKSFSSILQKYEITTLEQALECEELWDINNGITLCEECHKKAEIAEAV